MNEIKSLTGIRGIAAIWVVIFHYFFIYSQNLSPSYAWIHNVISKGYLSVDMFFILSAFVMTLSYRRKFQFEVSKENYIKYLIKRIARIIPLYFVIVGLSMFYQEKVSLTHILSYFSLTEVMLNTNSDTLNYPIWSLATEFFVYLILPFLLMIILKLKKIFDISLIIISIAILFAVQYLPSYYLDLNSKTIAIVDAKKNLDINWGVLAYVRTLLSYVIGIIIFKRYLIIPKFVCQITLVLLPILLMLVVNDIIIYLLLSLAPVVAIRLDLVNKILSWRPIFYLGEISYSIYLNHIFVLFLINYYAPELALKSLMAFPITIFLSILTYHFIEMPGKKILNKIAI